MNRWEQIKELGQGGFGCVCLFKHKVTDEYIAIKKLRIRQDYGEMSPKIWERWKQEVFMMNKLDHKNVIRAVEVPPELDAVPGESLVLGMEYCKGGDLRKLLTHPEHCCGLRESYIRDLLHDVGSAIEYLHNIRIIHRDIKPENIVLQPTEDKDKFLYKIIDLGYAKELDASSFCISHVGTQQYLAPELYGKHPYTRTVDYWSFGSVVFECITGKRPFLPELTSVLWHKEVSKKTQDDITAFYDDQGEVKFSKTLPETNQLCRPLCKFLEQWLKLMLRWDSKYRGGGVKVFEDGSERPKCFCVLEQILEMKIFHVLYAKANHLLSFPVKGDHTIATVHQAIETQIRIPVSQQLLIGRDGHVFPPEFLAIDACKDTSSENPSVFLFCQAPVPEDFKKDKKLPPSVGHIVKEPKIVLSFQGHKEAWKNVVCWCANEKRDCNQLMAGQRAFSLAVLQTVSHLRKQVVHMNDKMKELKSLVEYFQMSLQFDLNQFDSSESLNQDLTGMRTQIHNQWMQADREAKRSLALDPQASELHGHVNDLLIPEVTEVQKFSPKEISPLEICEKNAKKLYDKLRANRDTLDHQPMVDIVGHCMVKRDELTKTLHKNIDQMTNFFYKLRPTLPRIESFCNDIHHSKQRLIIMQKERQEDVWKLATFMLSLQNVNLMADTSMSQTSLWNGNNGNVPFLQSLSNNMESFRLVDDSKTTVQMMDEMLDEMAKEQEENFFSLQPSTVT